MTADISLSEFNTALYDKCGCEKGYSYVVGVSGGADSMCLLFLLTESVRKDGGDVTAVHINHGIRGAEARRDENHVAVYCAANGIKYEVISRDIPREARESGCTEEEAGRNARYAEFRRIAALIGADRIAVAHNRNDQAETVFMNLLRGCGLNGLRGMDHASGGIVRPLLDIRRERIESFCAVHAIPYVNDRTNSDDAYARNMIRLRVFPYIKEQTGRDITERICETAASVSADNAFMDEAAGKLLERAGFKLLQNNRLTGCDGGSRNGSGNRSSSENVCGCGDDAMLSSYYEGYGVTAANERRIAEFDTSEFIRAHIALRRRALFLALKRCGIGVKDIGQVHIDACIRLIEADNVGKRTELPGGAGLRTGYGKMYVTRRSTGERAAARTGVTADMSAGEGISGGIADAVLDIAALSVLPPGTAVELMLDGCTVTAQTAESADEFRQGMVGITAYNNKLTVRYRREGDRYLLNSGLGVSRLKDYFINEKIPRELRDRCVCVEAGGYIRGVFIVGADGKLIKTRVFGMHRPDNIPYPPNETASDVYVKLFYKKCAQ